VRTAQRLRLAFGGSIPLGDVAEQLAAAHGDTVLATSDDGRQWTANDVRDTVAKWGASIALRIRPGDRVIINGPNGYEFFMCCLAVCRAGGVAVPVNDKMKPAEIEHVTEDSGATLVIDRFDRFTPLKAGAVATIPVVNADDVAALFYTSGTTGLPKGAELTHHGLLSGVRRSAALPTWVRNDEVVFGLPVAHIMGFGALLGFAVAGVKVYTLQNFRPTDALDALESRKSSLFIGVPAMYRMMLEAGAADRDLKSVRVWMSGADSMPPEIAQQFQAFGASLTVPITGTHLGQAVFMEGYGMVELAGGAAFKITPPYAGGLLSKPVGIPLPNNELRVVDEDGKQVGFGQTGELQVRSPGVLRGYHGNPDATEATKTDDGWLRTGDLAKRGLLGTVEFAGRAKDVIKVGGYSVFAAEVQAVLELHPAVAEAVVVGLDDKRLGQVPAAAIRLKQRKKVTAEELEAFSVERLADQKVPRQWKFVKTLPRTGTEKIQRADVRALFD
jgi:acyl-CoA synthetase (AMP-forming)/AMP-acid ligase II